MSWEPSQIITDTIGRFQIVVGGQDVSYFRDVPSMVGSWSADEPFGDATARLVFPQITPFERYGSSADLTWLGQWREVEINLVRTDGTVENLWEGMVASVEYELTEDSYRLTATCMGKLYQVDLYVRAPRFFEKDVKVVSFLKSQFSLDSRPNLRCAGLVVRDPNGELDDESKRSGGWERTLTGFIQDELALLVDHDTWDQWTIHKEYPATPVLEKKDRLNQHWIVHCGAPGIELSLSRDFSQAPNTFYGEGTDEAGTSWRHTMPGHVGFYRPLAIAYNEGVGETFYEDTTVSDDYFSSTTQTEFEQGDENPEFDPSAVRIETHTSYGGGVSPARAQDSARGTMRQFVDPGWSGQITLKSDPEEGSRFEIQPGQNILLRWFHLRPPTDDDSYDLQLTLTDGTEAYWQYRTGVVWVWNATTSASDHIGWMFHVASVEADWENQTVTLTVDTKFRDALSLAEVLERTHDGNLDPAHRLRVTRDSSIPEDRKQPWDYHSGSGYLPLGSMDVGDPIDFPPSTNPDAFIHVDPYKNTPADKTPPWKDHWTIVPIEAATKATVMQTEITAYNSDGTVKPIRFSLAFHDEKVWGDSMISDPFHTDAWDPKAADPSLQPNPYVIIAWGQGEQPAGYWPGVATDGDPVTGVHRDHGTWQFQLRPEGEQKLWLAVYCEEETWFQGRIFQGVE